MSGAGAAGTAILKLLLEAGGQASDVVVADVDGVVHAEPRPGLRAGRWRWIAEHTNPRGVTGTLKEACAAPTSSSVSPRPDILDGDDVATHGRGRDGLRAGQPRPRGRPGEAAASTRPSWPPARSTSPTRSTTCWSSPGSSAACWTRSRAPIDDDDAARRRPGARRGGRRRRAQRGLHHAERVPPRRDQGRRGRGQEAARAASGAAVPIRVAPCTTSAAIPRVCSRCSRHDGGMSGLTGQLLVASPRLADDNFKRSVVLLLDHGDEGGRRHREPAAGGRRAAVLPAWQPYATMPGRLSRAARWRWAPALGVVAVPGDDDEPVGVRRILGSLGLVDLDTPPEIVAGGVAGLRIARATRLVEGAARGRDRPGCLVRGRGRGPRRVHRLARRPVAPVLRRQRGDLRSSSPRTRTIPSQN